MQNQYSVWEHAALNGAFVYLLAAHLAYLPPLGRVPTTIKALRVFPSPQQLEVTNDVRLGGAHVPNPLVGAIIPANLVQPRPPGWKQPANLPQMPGMKKAAAKNPAQWLQA